MQNAFSKLAFALTLALLSTAAVADTSGSAATSAPSNIASLPSRDPVIEGLNKQLITLLSNNLLGNGDINALGTFFASDLIQHDPAVQDGRAAMLQWISAQRALVPARTLTIKHVLADRDLVLVHSQVSATPGNEMSGSNRYDIYRLDRGVIVEHWAVRSGVPAQTESGNSMFSNLYVYPGPVPRSNEAHEEFNRLLVKNLSEQVFGNRNFALLDTFWAQNYIQHNPYVGNGRAALKEVIDYIAPAGSNYRVVKSMADGDLSLVCSQNTDPGVDPANEFAGAAVCDLYRVVGFELVEHWDVAQAVPATSANGHSMFSDLYRRR